MKKIKIMLLYGLAITIAIALAVLYLSTLQTEGCTLRAVHSLRGIKLPFGSRSPQGQNAK